MVVTSTFSKVYIFFIYRFYQYTLEIFEKKINMNIDECLERKLVKLSSQSIIITNENNDENTQKTTTMKDKSSMIGTKRTSKSKIIKRRKKRKKTKKESTQITTRQLNEINQMELSTLTIKPVNFMIFINNEEIKKSEKIKRRIMSLIRNEQTKKLKPNR